ncbi:MAG: hypothetical protein RL329_2230 [Bacteroidota bacterium]
MGKTPKQGFDKFLESLAPCDTEYDLAQKHKKSVEASLKNHSKAYQFRETGSFGNGTGIRHYSDTDYFAVIRQDNLLDNSQKALSNLRANLENTFPSTSGIKVNSPAVNIPFGKFASESLEVTPCFATGNHNNFRVYKIPDGNGGWREASPQAHNHYVKKIDVALQGTLKSMIRLIKAWKYFNNVPIRSFYLEIAIAKKYANRKTRIVYEKELHSVFEYLHKIKLQAIQDPMEISGSITACDSPVKRDDALSKLNTALTRATKASHAYESGKFEDAFVFWNLLFNKKFPAY